MVCTLHAHIVNTRERPAGVDRQRPEKLADHCLVRRARLNPKGCKPVVIRHGDRVGGKHLREVRHHEGPPTLVRGSGRRSAVIAFAH